MMNRIIKYEGIRIDNDKKVVGHLVIDPQGRYRIYQQPFDGASSNTFYFVDKETVFQHIDVEGKTGVYLIAEERERQIKVKGYTLDNDINYEDGELAGAGAFYALPDGLVDFINMNWGNDNHLYFYPFDLKHANKDTTGNPRARVRDLQKAGALIAAEIDRILSSDEYKNGKEAEDE